jgi:hypothetical protein
VIADAALLTGAMGAHIVAEHRAPRQLVRGETT